MKSGKPDFFILGVHPHLKNNISYGNFICSNYSYIDGSDYEYYSIITEGEDQLWMVSNQSIEFPHLSLYVKVNPNDTQTDIYPNSGSYDMAVQDFFKKNKVYPHKNTILKHIPKYLDQYCYETTISNPTTFLCDSLFLLGSNQQHNGY